MPGVTTACEHQVSAPWEDTEPGVGRSWGLSVRGRSWNWFLGAGVFNADSQADVAFFLGFSFSNDTMRELMCSIFLLSGLVQWWQDCTWGILETVPQRSWSIVVCSTRLCGVSCPWAHLVNSERAWGETGGWSGVEWVWGRLHIPTVYRLEVVVVKQIWSGTCHNKETLPEWVTSFGELPSPELAPRGQGPWLKAALGTELSSFWALTVCLGCVLSSRKEHLRMRRDWLLAPFSQVIKVYTSPLFCEGFWVCSES